MAKLKSQQLKLTPGLLTVELTVEFRLNTIFTPYLLVHPVNTIFLLKQSVNNPLCGTGKIVCGTRKMVRVPLSLPQ